MRYLRLYGYFVRFSVSTAMEFRFDFFFRIGMDLLWYAMHFCFFEVLYLHTPVFAGLDPDQMTVFLATVFLFDALQMTIVMNNLWWLPFLVNRGDLDYYLVRPVSSLFFLSTRSFAANSFVNLLMTIGFMVWALGRYPLPLGAGAIAGFLALIVVGAFVGYLLQLLFTIPVFWMHSGTGLRDVNFSLAQYQNRPDRTYRGWVRRVFVTVLPYVAAVSFPVNTLFTSSVGDALQIAAYMLLLAVVFLGFTLWLWNRALRAYASASS